jgi:hypothetical protein
MTLKNLENDMNTKMRDLQGAMTSMDRRVMDMS